MPGLSAFSALLQRLPANVRKTWYSVVSIAGAVLAACQIAGWKTLGPIDIEQAMQAYAFIAPTAGVVAVANVSPADPGFEDLGQDFYDDFDVSSFNATAGEEAFDG